MRTQLTHSLEVQQVGHYIAKEVLTRLQEQGQLTMLGLVQLTAPFENIVEMACLMHDIGNPPFGHFGESAVNDWFRQQLDAGWQSESQHPDHYVPKVLSHCDDGLDELRANIRQNLSHFEGNAQAIRMVHTLMKMNLT